MINKCVACVVSQLVIIWDSHLDGCVTGWFIMQVRSRGYTEKQQTTAHRYRNGTKTNFTLKLGLQLVYMQVVYTHEHKCIWHTHIHRYNHTHTLCILREDNGLLVSLPLTKGKKMSKTNRKRNIKFYEQMSSKYADGLYMILSSLYVIFTIA